MKNSLSWVAIMALLTGLSCPAAMHAQESAGDQAPVAAAADLPPEPKGVEVQARGPVHEAFATPTTPPEPTKLVPKQPPKLLNEMPPDEKPDGDVVWIGGYWAWEDDRNDFLWVSGIWRKIPPGKQWVAGYWRQEASNWQWVPGFWTTAEAESSSPQITYFPAPPAPPALAPPGPPPTRDSFYVPGVWLWDDGRYVWRAGYWAQVQPGYMWVAAHYRWTPSGYVYIPGYWDLAIAQRGVLFAPVVVDQAVVGATFVYRPIYVVPDTVVMDAFFVRPCFCHYYFGDYYGPVYRDYGFESVVVYSRRSYDPVFTYAVWEHRDEPTWTTLQVDICLGRDAGRYPCPARTLVQQNITNVTNVNNVTNVTNVNNVVHNTTNTTINRTFNNRSTTVNNRPSLMPFNQFTASRKIRTVPLSAAALATVRQQSQAVQLASLSRRQTEISMPAGPTMKPRVANLEAPRLQPVGSGSTKAAYSPMRTSHSTAGIAGSGGFVNHGLPSRFGSAPAGTGTPSSVGAHYGAMPSTRPNLGHWPAQGGPHPAPPWGNYSHLLSPSSGLHSPNRPQGSEGYRPPSRMIPGSNTRPQPRPAPRQDKRQPREHQPN